MSTPLLWQEAPAIREICSDTINFQRFFLQDWSQTTAVKILQACPNNIRRIVRLQAGDTASTGVILFTNSDDFKLVAAAGGGAYFPTGFRLPASNTLFQATMNAYARFVTSSALWAVAYSASLDTTLDVCIEGYYVETE